MAKNKINATVLNIEKPAILTIILQIVVYRDHVCVSHIVLRKCLQGVAQVENSVITNKCSRIGRQSRAPRAIANAILPRILESSNEKKNDDSRVTPARADRTE